MPDFLTTLHKYLSEILEHRKLRSIKNSNSEGKIPTPEGMMDETYNVRKEIIAVTDKVCKLEDQINDVLRKLDKIVYTCNNSNQNNITVRHY